jgi:ribose transport system substrate-binding protein
MINAAKRGQRRAAGVALAVASAAVLAACSSGSGAGSSSNAANQSTASGKKIVIDLIDLNNVSGDPFYGSLNCGATQEASQLGVTLKVLAPAGAQASPQAQLPVLNAAIATKPDAIVMAASSSTALTPTIHQAMQQGIKFVMVDQPISDLTGVSSVVASDNDAVGEAAGQEMAKLLGDSGSAAVLSVQAGVPAGDERVSGFQAGLNGTGVNFAGILRDPTVSTSTSAGLVTALLTKDSTVRGVYGVIDPLTAGIIAAAKQDNLTGKLDIIDTDATPSEVALLKAGTVQALVAQRPTVIGSDGIQQAYNAVTGKAVTAKITPSILLVTKDNVDSSSVAPYLYSSSCSQS